MRSHSINVLVVCFAAVSALAMSRAALAQDAGAKAYAETCSACHSPKVRPLDKKRMTRDEWKKAIDKMTDLGAEIPKDKAEKILDYLARTQGPDSK